MTVPGHRHRQSELGGHARRICTNPCVGGTSVAGAGRYPVCRVGRLIGARADRRDSVQQGLRNLSPDGVVTFGRYSDMCCRNLHRMIDEYMRP